MYNNNRNNTFPTVYAEKCVKTSWLCDSTWRRRSNQTSLLLSRYKMERFGRQENQTAIQA